MRRAGVLTGGVVALILLDVVCITPPAVTIKLSMTSHRFMNSLITMSDGLTRPPYERPQPSLQRNHHIELLM